MERRLHDGHLLAYEAARGAGWEFEPFGQHPACPDGLPIGEEAGSLLQAVEAADEWAAAQGYPVARVEVDG